MTDAFRPEDAPNSGQWLLPGAGCLHPSVTASRDGTVICNHCGSDQVVTYMPAEQFDELLRTIDEPAN